MNIVITGFMGSGKSTVGRQLAGKLKFQLVDTDELIEKDVGMPIRKIFQRKGEPYFREVESKVIALVSLADDQVIATGGGVPLNLKNMDELERNGVVIHLNVTPEAVLQRIGSDTSRPLLQTKDPLATARQILNSRKNAYSRCALSIDTDSLSIDDIVTRIAGFYQNNRKEAGPL